MKLKDLIKKLKTKKKGIRERRKSRFNNNISGNKEESKFANKYKEINGKVGSSYSSFA